MSDSAKASIAVGPSGVDVASGHTTQHAKSRSVAASERRTGSERLYVNFGATGAAFRRIVGLLAERRLWVLLDEWSSIPVVLQPYLADLLRRSLFPIQGVTAKIAAIEQRSELQIRHPGGDCVGIELGADASADVSLDDFMVFDNDEERATDSFAA